MADTMPRCSGQLLIAACVALHIACAGAEETAPSVDVTEEEGVTVVSTSGGPIHAGDVFTFEPVLALRQDPDDTESLLYRAFEFTVGDDDLYYVADRGNSRVAVFDAKGNYVRSIGEAGQGPGELSEGFSIQSLIDDELNLFDYRLRRASLFRTDGTLIETLSVANGTTGGVDRSSDGALLYHDLEALGMREDGSGEVLERIVIEDATGSRTIATVSTAAVVAKHMTRTERPDGIVFSTTRQMPFAGSPTAVYVPEKEIILVSDGDKPELRWYDTGGELIQIVRLGLPERPVSETILAAYEERRTRLRAEAEARTGQDYGPLVELAYPKTGGFWTDAIVDDRGYVWLADAWQPYQRASDDGWLFHVVDPEGRYLGTAELPADGGNIAKGRLMTFIEDPETGERVPTVFRIRPAVEGLAYPY